MSATRLAHCRPCSRHTPLLALLFVVVTTFASPSMAQVSESLCGPLANAYGPYDYRTSKKELEVVERFHFTSPVEALVRGATGSIAGDLSYTLRTSPNHHRALLAMMRLAEREKLPQANGAQYSVDCYFDRALRFQSNDTFARLLFAQWLMKTGRDADARTQLKAVADLAGDDPFTHYNVGLVYMDLKAYDLALVHAHKALALGLARTDLRDRLRAVGQWVEPAAPAASAASAN